MKHKTLKHSIAVLFSPENRAKTFYLLAFAPFIPMIYFHLGYPSAIVIPIYGFLLLILKKPKLLSYQEPRAIQKILGSLLILSSLFVYLPIQLIFPLAAYYGAANYAVHLIGLFLLFFKVSALKEAFAPVFLLLAASAATTISHWAEPHFSFFLPFLTRLIVAILNFLGIEAIVLNPQYANVIIMFTPRGHSASIITWACIGFESALTFAILLVIVLWEEPGRLKTKTLWSIVGLIGTMLLNIFRLTLVLVAKYFFGRETSATVHSYIGYILFIVWITAFLFLFSKREAIQAKIGLAWQKLNLKRQKSLKQ